MEKVGLLGYVTCHRCKMIGVRMKAKADSILKTIGLGCGAVIDMLERPWLTLDCEWSASVPGSLTGKRVKARVDNSCLYRDRKSEPWGLMLIKQDPKLGSSHT